MNLGFGDAELFHLRHICLESRTLFSRASLGIVLEGSQALLVASRPVLRFKYDS